MTGAIVLGIDQGTSGTKAYLMDQDGHCIGFGYRPIQRLKPQPGWSELNPDLIAESAREAIALALHEANIRPLDVKAIGIASQRDTDFVWDARTGAPLDNAITWQDLRTTTMVEALKDWESEPELRSRLGYYPGPWCTAIHLGWRARHQPFWQHAANGGYLRVGMAASWLLTSLGKPAEHLHDFSLTQKTGLWDYRAGEYWSEWMDYLGLSMIGLPQPAPTLYPYGELCITDHSSSAFVPVVAMIGDQQATLFGHGCYQPGQTECTHGTASFININIGHSPPAMENLNVYHAWSLPEGDQVAPFQHTYCLEADTTVTGAAVRWMHDQARLLDQETEIDELVQTVPDADGVTFIPAFTGLNVPYNDLKVRGTILGLKLSTERAHIVRAFLDSLGYQLRAILETVTAQTGLHFTQLSVGGGLSRSDQACQIQADMLGIPVIRPSESETTARGAALLAGLGANLWSDLDDLPSLPPGGSIFEPNLPATQREAGYHQWQQAIALIGKQHKDR